MKLETGNRLQNRLVLAPRHQLFLSLLNLPYPGLEGFVRKEAEENPFLEYDPGRKNMPLVSDLPDNHFRMENLLQQMRLSTDSARLEEAGQLVIANLERDGYLRKSCGDMAAEGGFEVDEMERGVRLVQSLEPAGIAARDLRECLLLQVERYFPGEILLRSLLLDHWQSIVKKDYGKIGALLGIDPSRVSGILAGIRKLSFSPLSCLAEEDRRFIVTEGRIEPEGGSMRVHVEERIFPFLQINDLYEKYSRNPALTPGEKSYMEKKFRQARMLMKVLSDRHEFLVKIFLEISSRQKKFLLGGSLEPMREKDVAWAMNVSISTVSRAVNGKYLDTPRGILRIRDFFSGRIGGGSLSSHYVAGRIREITAGEKSPLSDREIAARLSCQGIMVSVRTVNKYRHREGIMNSYLRRK